MSMPGNDTNGTEFSKEQNDFLDLYLKNNCIISKTCKALNIARITYYRWIKNNTDFLIEVRQAQESIIDRIEDIVIEKALAGDYKFIKLFLESKAKNRGYTKKITEVDEREHKIVVDIVPSNLSELAEMCYEKRLEEEGLNDY